MSKKIIGMGSRVTLHFTLSMASGLVIDNTDPNEPMTLVIGQGDIAPGLEKYLMGLGSGEQRHVDIPAGEVYGAAGQEALHRFARSDFPADLLLQPGQVIGFTLPSGEEVPALVVTVEDDRVQVDLSHPLAGHDLVFDVDILSLDPA